MSLSPAKQKFVDLAAAKYGEGAILEMAHVTRVEKKMVLDGQVGLFGLLTGLVVVCLNFQLRVNLSLQLFQDLK